ncbi:MAG: DUF4350 domain-containing protein [Novosphingobium sp.]|nr:DUF4350 domain-containing protein [Novosphingobium sp.]
MSAGGASPFSPRAALALVGFGALVFVALLWMIGAGMTGGSTNDGGGHAGGKGLNGYAALAGLLERRGHAVRRTRADDAFTAPGLLVLTPPHDAKPEAIDSAIARHRYAGPTLLVLPKWRATKASGKGSRTGWVWLTGAATPDWANRIARIGPLDLRLAPLGPGQARWTAGGRSGTLAAPQAVQSMSSGRIAALVRDGAGGTLAGYLDDAGYYPVLANAAGVDPGAGEDEDIHPVIVVAEPDLLDNYGLADRDRAMLALALIRAATGGDNAMPVSFDLTLNGHGRSANLLTLAFTPPFLAATLCLLLAALVVGWRAFLRFGPAKAPDRVIAFGKRALVANAAGLIRRTRRLHLVTGPYAAAARERLVRALALARRADPAASEEAIDRALAARQPDAIAFSTIAARLRAARRPHDIVKAAQDLHALERTLIR